MRIYRFRDILTSLARAIYRVNGHYYYYYYYGPITTTTTEMRFYDQNGNAQIWRSIIGREMIDPWLCSTKMEVCNMLYEKFLSRHYDIMNHDDVINCRKILREFSKNSLFLSSIFAQKEGRKTNTIHYIANLMSFKKITEISNYLTSRPRNLRFSEGPSKRLKII